MSASFGRLCVGPLAVALLIGCGDDSATGGTGAGSAGGNGGAGAGDEGGGGSGPLTGEPVKILNWNLHNFFDTVEDNAAEGDDSLNTGEYNDKLEGMVAIISELDPDVLVLQEIENEDVLADINDALGGKYPEQAVTEGNDPRGIDIAALSKIEFTSVVSHLNESFEVEGTQAPSFNFTRDLLEYHFQVGEQKVVLLGVHFKAKGTPTSPDNPDKRLAEAQRARAVADELTAADSSLAVLILGDYNDLPDSPPLDAIGGDGEYVDSANAVAETDRWTFNFEGSLELIDHQMANSVMQSRLDPASVTIRHGSDVDDVSDHAPLMATYLFE